MNIKTLYTPNAEYCTLWYQIVRVMHLTPQTASEQFTNTYE